MHPALVAALDAAAVLVFVLAGLASHDRSAGAALAVAAPFLAAGLVAHLAVRRGRERLWPGGVAVWLITWGGGMALRALLDDGVAPAFVAVGLAVLGALLLGWRAARALVRRRGRRAAASPAS
jgi:hypothetical protein